MGKQRTQTGKPQNVTVTLQPEQIVLLDAVADRHYGGVRQNVLRALVEQWCQDVRMANYMLQEGDGDERA